MFSAPRVCTRADDDPKGSKADFRTFNYKKRKGLQMNKLCLPTIPVLRAMHCEDHKTFVAPYRHKNFFIEKRKSDGLTALPAIITEEFPAEHIAMVEKPGATRTCERMVGLSVSLDPNSPINKLCELGKNYSRKGILQHIAYAVAPETSFQNVRSELESKGVVFMTPILEYKDLNGATLRQMFVACEVPFGPFIEIIERTPGTNGVPFQGFNAGQIDNLYRYYNEYSLNLSK